MATYGTAITGASHVVTTTRGAGALLPVTLAGASTMSFANKNEDCLLVVKNGGGGSINVSFKIRPTIDGKAVADLTAAVAAGETRLFGPFPKAIYNFDDNGDDEEEAVHVDLSGTASVTVGVVKVGTLAY